MNRENKFLVTILVILTLSVLVTGGLAVHLTLARAGEQAGDGVVNGWAMHRQPANSILRFF